jgi:hypothetical protein
MNLLLLLALAFPFGCLALLSLIGFLGVGPPHGRGGAATGLRLAQSTFV